MHRVELKVKLGYQVVITALYVVPNAPCGVERGLLGLLSFSHFSFLMHRVELKAVRREGKTITTSPVPNAPCGVESLRLLPFYSSL